MDKFQALALGAATFAASMLPAAMNARDASYDIVPLPVEVNMQSAPGFTVDSKTKIVYPKGNLTLKKNAEILSGYVENLTGLHLAVTDRKAKSNAIVLTDNLDNANKEAYRLTVGKNLITIDGASAAGNFYGIQTLRKSIPGKAADNEVTFPAVVINDQPRFSYRGGHFDVARHFFPTDSVKKFIDMLALHNNNTLHWHLTDDQGWRIESKRYPKLAEIGQWRSGTMVGKDFESTDNVPYGGYYTQDELRDIVRYAADRHITIIPEIDLPGHMLAALQAYPELGCTGGPYAAWTKWGVSEDLLCAGNDSTLAFIDGILEEVMDIFPSEYIHVGGDECPKVRWEKCPKCQARIAELGLASDEHSSKEQKLQTYVMTHASNTLAKRGRKMIGWDEIMEGGLTPGSVIMSWRGEEGGLKAAQQGHDAIMTPTNFCYFDYYQTLDTKDEPLAIGGYVPLSKVYSYNPVPDYFTPEEASHILGAQANLWTEYIPTFSYAMYQELPRFAALSEVQWRQPEVKDFKEFTHRVPGMMKHYDAEGLNYARHIFDVQGTLENCPEEGTIIATFETVDGAPVRYTLDGSEPTEASPLYTSPLHLDKTCAIKAKAFRPDGKGGKTFSDAVKFSKATGHAVKLGNAPHSRYDGDPSILVDGRFGPKAFNTGLWLGFEGKPFIATVDLGKPMEISQVVLRNNVDTPNWIFDGRGLTVEVSDDGKTFTEVAREEYPVMQSHKEEVVAHDVKFSPVTARYVRITEPCEMSIPVFHGIGAGKVGFLFVDEIEIN